MHTLARLAPRLALGAAIALALGLGFVPIVIRIYGSGGSLAGDIAPGTIAAASAAANVLVLACAALALRGRGEDRPRRR